MDLLEDMIKKAFRKIDNANSNFCGTPGVDAIKTSKQVASSIMLGKGNIDDLLGSAGKKQRGRCTEKTCTHQH
ncbi:MAG: hypothetical protein K2X81_04015 [Candidatus Obscuribacterales bacterium]|nr:hypothetical protein [Candidatus Obscuribacterales bacterium]